MIARGSAALLFWLGLLASAGAGEPLTVAPLPVADEKAVFATVESPRIVLARARIGGTVAEIGAREGDRVSGGQVVATVGDEKIVLQLKSLDAQIAGIEAHLAQARIDLARAEELFSRGTVPRSRLDEARTAFNVADNALRARIAERSVLEQRLAEGAVQAPAAGRVLKVRLTPGTVVLPGDPVADVAAEDFVLRLRVPERHAGLLKAGDVVRVDAAELGDVRPRFGTIRLVYPQIEDGRVVVDAVVEGLGDYFVGKRIRVWVAAGERIAFVVPERFVFTRYGVDYVKVSVDDARVIDVPVQRGRPLPRPDMPDGLEILSGLNPGDRLVLP